MSMPYDALFAKACEHLMAGAKEREETEDLVAERASLAKAPRVV